MIERITLVAVAYLVMVPVTHGLLVRFWGRAARADSAHRYYHDGTATCNCSWCRGVRLWERVGATFWPLLVVWIPLWLTARATVHTGQSISRIVAGTEEKN